MTGIIWEMMIHFNPCTGRTACGLTKTSLSLPQHDISEGDENQSCFKLSGLHSPRGHQHGCLLQGHHWWDTGRSEESMLCFGGDCRLGQSRTPSCFVWTLWSWGCPGTELRPTRPQLTPALENGALACACAC